MSHGEEKCVYKAVSDEWKGAFIYGLGDEKHKKMVKVSLFTNGPGLAKEATHSVWCTGDFELDSLVKTFGTKAEAEACFCELEGVDSISNTHLQSLGFVNPHL